MIQIQDHIGHGKIFYINGIFLLVLTLVLLLGRFLLYACINIILNLNIILFKGITCDLTNNSINTLNLKKHNLTGTLTKSLGDFSNLIKLDLSFNNLFGSQIFTMGNIFSKLTRMEIFQVESNKLSGLLPFNALAKMTNLSQLHLNENLFSGNIPAVVSAFKKLGLLKLRDNLNINGTIPVEFGDLPSLYEVHLSKNHLTGTLPSSISKLSQLKYFSIRNNNISGTLPSYFGLFTKMQQLSVYGNAMTGTIPSELQYLSSIDFLILYDNYFNGTIPSALGNLRNMSLLLIGNNFLTGQIPSELGNISRLQYLGLYNNTLIGSIPKSAENLRSLRILDISGNFLTGIIPSGIFNLPLKRLLLFNNQLTGSLPEFGMMADSIELINLNSNSLTGELPLSFSKCINLQEFYILANSFNGDLTRFFTDSTFPNITAIDLSSNKFSGDFPSKIFQKSLLKSLYISKNCFKSFPGDIICDAKNLTNLVFDGMTNGESCNTPFLPISNSYLSNNFQATLPVCIFSLPYLETIQFSGLGLIGELSYNLELPTTAKVVRLGNNNLYGVIPLSFINQKLDTLDLSSNFISGVWESINSTSTDLRLFSNRISGFPPTLADQMLTVDVLSGNKFDCSEEHQVSHDIRYASTTCGSQILDSALIVWGVISFCVIILSTSYVFINTKSSYVSNIYKQLKQSYIIFKRHSFDNIIIPREFKSLPNSNMREIICLYFEIVKLLFTVGFSILFLYLFIFGLLRNQGFDTHEFQYSWKYSGAYFTGPVPAIIIMIPFWIISIALICFVRNLKIDRTSDYKSTKLSKAFKLLAILFFINFIVKVIVDVSYVYSQVSNTSNALKIFIQFIISIWNVIWNLMIIPSILTFLEASPGVQFKGRTICRVFNLLISSTLSTILADPLCYQSLFEPKYTQSSYSIPYCVENIFSNGNITCVENGFIGPFSSQYLAPFQYSHICYSAILVNYSPIILYSNIIQLISCPLSYILPLKFIKSGEKFLFLPQIIWSPLFKELDWSILKHQPFFKWPKLLSSVFYYLAIILTFGLLCPPIMVSVLLAFGVEILTFLYFLRRFLIMCVKCRSEQFQRQDSRDDQSLVNVHVTLKEIITLDNKAYDSSRISDEIKQTEYEQILEEECANINLDILRAMSGLVFVCSFFMCCVTLDIGASEYNSWKSYLSILILNVMIPLLGNLIVRFYKKNDIMRLIANRDTINSIGQIQIPEIQSQRSSSDKPIPRDVELTIGLEHNNNESSLDDDRTICHSEDHAPIEQKNSKLDIEKEVPV